MTLSAPFLRSRVSRRMFSLFVLCALAPVAALAVVTYTSVRAQLAQDTEERLRQASRALGMAVSERLGFLEDDLRQQVAYWDQRGVARDASGVVGQGEEAARFLSLGVGRPGETGASLVGTSAAVALTPKEQRHLESGKSVLRVLVESAGTPHIVLIAAVPTPSVPDRVAVGDVRPDYLWGIGQHDTLPYGMSLVALAGGAILATTQADAEAVAVSIGDALTRTSTGVARWSGLEADYVSGYWTLPLGFRYGVDPWTIVLSQKAAEALAPLQVFSQSFALVVLLSLGAVILVSSVQIRHSLVPLEQLQEGTRRIAGRDFTSRVAIETGDEFQDLGTAFNDMAARLDRQFTTLHTIGAIDRAALSLMDVSRIVEVVLVRSREWREVDGGGVLLVDRHDPRMAVFYRRSMADETGVTVGAVGLAEADRNGLAEAPVRAVFDVPSVPAWMRSCGTEASALWTAYPMRRSHEFIGCLVVASRRPGDQHGEEEGQWRALADQMALALANAHDVGRRREAEEHLRDSHRQLEQALQELKAAQQQMLQQERLRALGQMASGICHDFNNALYPIIGFSELLLLDPEALKNTKLVAERLETMNLAACDAAKIVSRLRDFYRPRDTHDLAIPVDVNELIKQTVTLTQPKWRDQAQANGLTVEVVTDIQPVSLIAGEEAELREVFTNLLFNAVDAMRHRGTITFRTRMEAGQVQVEVADTGAGMTEEVRQRCLEPFFSTKGDKGTGLGLAMVYGIVRRSGGSLDVRSVLGEGTTFVLRFPVAQLSAGPVQGAEDEPLPRGWRVLVVDDDPLVGQVTAEYVKASGQHPELVRNGLDAVARCRTHRYDLVVTDRGMPDINGLELAGFVKAASPRTPVLLLSGVGDPDGAAGAPSEGVDAALDKPLSMPALQAVLRKLNRGQAEAHTALGG